MRATRVSRPGTRPGSSTSHSATTSSGVAAGPELDPHRVADAAQELEVGAVQLPGPLPHPQQVGRAVVPAPGEAVAPGHGLLVAEQQGLVGGVEVDLVDDRGGGQVDAAGGHEAQRPVDAVGDRVVAPARRAPGHELLVPAVHLVEVGEAALGEGPQQVQGGRRTGGRRAACRVGSGWRAAASKPSSLTMSPRYTAARPRRRSSLGRLRGLANWPAIRPTLTTGTPGAVGQHHRHLEDDLELVADGVGREGVEGLRAVARLEQEAVPVGDRGQGRLEGPGLAGEHQRRQGGQLVERPGRARPGRASRAAGRPAAPARSRAPRAWARYGRWGSSVHRRRSSPPRASW